MAERVIASTVDELLSASKSSDVENITIRDHIADSPSFHLAPGQSLQGEDDQAGITFAAGADGVQVSSDNSIRGIQLHTTPDMRAIYNDPSVATLGQLEIRRVVTTGRVQLLGRENVRGGHVDVSGLDIIAADARKETDRPHGYGVYVLQGAFTL
jgi:hypothetical protein